MGLSIPTRFCGLLLGLWAFATSMAAQTPTASAATTATAAPKRQLVALRITQAPKPGVPEKHSTEVRVLYYDTAIYVSAIMHDVSPDSIPRELTARDNTGNSNSFALFLDAYSDHLNGYGSRAPSPGRFHSSL